MDEHDKNGTEQRSNKRPASEVRPSTEDADDVPAPKRLKVTDTQHVPIQPIHPNHVHIFWSRIFVALVPDACHNGHFRMPSSAPKSERTSSSLLCVSIDMDSQPKISTIKAKIQAQHGTLKAVVPESLPGTSSLTHFASFHLQATMRPSKCCGTKSYKHYLTMSHVQKVLRAQVRPQEQEEWRTLFSMLTEVFVVVISASRNDTLLDSGNLNKIPSATLNKFVNRAKT